MEYFVGRPSLGEGAKDHGLISVIDGPGSPLHIGVATQAEQFVAGQHVYKLTIGGILMAGYWVIDRDRFIRLEEPDASQATPL